MMDGCIFLGQTGLQRGESEPELIQEGSISYPKNLAIPENSKISKQPEKADFS